MKMWSAYGFNCSIIRKTEITNWLRNTILLVVEITIEKYYIASCI